MILVSVGLWTNFEACWPGTVVVGTVWCLPGSARSRKLEKRIIFRLVVIFRLSFRVGPRQEPKREAPSSCEFNTRYPVYPVPGVLLTTVRVVRQIPYFLTVLYYCTTTVQHVVCCSTTVYTGTEAEQL